MVMESRAFDAQCDSISEVIVSQWEAFEFLGAFEERVCFCYLIHEDQMSHYFTIACRERFLCSLSF